MAFVVAGCGAGISPEHKAALIKVQDLGGHVDFEQGGYSVNLNGTPVEDDDLACLKDIANIKRVYLKGTRITDQGLAHLALIPTIEVLSIERSGTTPQGVEGFKKALPKAQVRH